LRQFARLCTSSPFISEFPSHHPVLPDELPDGIDQPPEKTELQDELRQQLLCVEEDNLDAQMELLRYFKQSHMLYFAAAQPGSWFNSAMGYGTLGYALPASLGASLAAPDRPVVCLIGDGGLHYTLGELAAIRAHGRPVIVICWNNAAFGEIRIAMEAEDIAPVGVELFAPDFRGLAEAYGFVAESPSGMDELPGMLRAAATRSLPTFICLEERIALGRD
jgi:hypothetical protein